VMWQFSGLFDACQSGQNNKTGSPRAVESVRLGQVLASAALPSCESFSFLHDVPSLIRRNTSEL